MKKFLCILFAIIMLLALPGCESPDGSSQFGQDSSSKSTEPSPDFSIPGTLVAENFDLTIVSAEVCDKVTLDSGIEIEVEPDEGKQFLVLCIDAKSTSDDIRNLGSFLAYVDNITVLPHNMLGKFGDRILFVGAVNPGKIMCTYIMYQVPTSWETFELSYVDSLTGSISKSITILRSDITTNDGAGTNDAPETTPNVSINTEEKLFTVEITLPASMFEGEDMSDFDTVEYAKENGFISATLNADGSITITMSKAKHNELLVEMSKSLEDTFSGYVDAADTPYIKEITHNGDFSSIVIKVNKEAYEHAFDFTAFAVGISAMYYQAFLDMEYHVEVSIVDVDTGDTISTTNYPDAFGE